MIANDFGQLQSDELQQKALSDNDYFRNLDLSLQAAKNAQAQQQLAYEDAFQRAAMQNQVANMQSAEAQQQFQNRLNQQGLDIQKQSTNNYGDYFKSIAAHQRWQEDQASGEVDNAGGAFADQFGQVYADHNDAYAGLREAQDDFAQAKQAIDPDKFILTPSKMDRFGNPITPPTVMPKPGIKADPTQVNQQLASAWQGMLKAQADYNTSQKQLQGTTMELQRNGFVPDFNNGDIVHLRTGKRFDYMGTGEESSDEDQTAGAQPAAAAGTAPAAQTMPTNAAATPQPTAGVPHPSFLQQLGQFVAEPEYAPLPIPGSAGPGTPVQASPPPPVVNVRPRVTAPAVGAFGGYEGAFGGGAPTNAVTAPPPSQAAPTVTAPSVPSVPGIEADDQLAEQFQEIATARAPQLVHAVNDALDRHYQDITDVDPKTLYPFVLQLAPKDPTTAMALKRILDQRIQAQQAGRYVTGKAAPAYTMGYVDGRGQ